MEGDRNAERCKEKSKKNAFGPTQWDHPIQHSEKESQRPGAGSDMYRFDSNPRETITKAREPTKQKIGKISPERSVDPCDQTVNQPAAGRSLLGELVLRWALRLSKRDLFTMASPTSADPAMHR